MLSARSQLFDTVRQAWLREIGPSVWLNGLDRIRISISLHTMHVIPMMEEMLMSPSYTRQIASWDSLLWSDEISLEN